MNERYTYRWNSFDPNRGPDSWHWLITGEFPEILMVSHISILPLPDKDTSEVMAREMCKALNREHENTLLLTHQVRPELLMTDSTRSMIPYFPVGGAVSPNFPAQRANWEKGRAEDRAWAEMLRSVSH